jgi:hypothetical protein
MECLINHHPSARSVLSPFLGKNSDNVLPLFSVLFHYFHILFLKFPSLTSERFHNVFPMSHPNSSWWNQVTQNLVLVDTRHYSIHYPSYFTATCFCNCCCFMLFREEACLARHPRAQGPGSVPICHLYDVSMKLVLRIIFWYWRGPISLL